MKRKQTHHHFETDDSSGRRTRTWRGALGQAAGATLGYIVGDVPGAVVGGHFGRQFSETDLPQQNMVRRNANIVNRQANRAAMKTKGHKNLKSVVGRKRNVKVSKSLRDKVKKVIEGAKMYGQYNTVVQGVVGLARSAVANNDYPNQPVGAYAFNRWYSRQGSSTNTGNSRNIFQGLIQGSATMVVGDDFLHFTPLRMLDAVSVLWNSKAVSKDYTLQTGNFSLNTINATRAPSALGTPALPAPGPFKVHVINSFVKYEMRNTSQRLLYVNFYNCVPKVSYPEAAPLDTLYGGLVAEADSATEIKRIHYNFGAGGNIDFLFNNPNLHPNMVDKFNSVYKYEKMEMSIAPGETCVHYVQGPKNLDYDFGKLFNGGDSKIGYLNKHSVACLIEVKPDLEMASAGVPVVVTGAGRWVFPTTGSILDPLAVEITHTYKMSMPEASGFYTTALVANQVQPLNLRKPSLAFGDFTIDPTEGTLVYDRIDEENPPDPIAGSARN